MGYFNNLNRNASGNYDGTAMRAIRNADREAEKESKSKKKKFDTPYDPEAARFHNFLKAVWKMAEASGYHIENRLVVKDTKTSKIWE